MEQVLPILQILPQMSLLLEAGFGGGQRRSMLDTDLTVGVFNNNDFPPWLVSSSEPRTCPSHTIQQAWVHPGHLFVKLP